MIKTVWRLVKPQFSKTAFDGAGSRTNGGRWNNKGVSVIYTAESKSLAVMEILVHVESTELLDTYLCIPIKFDSSLVKKVSQKSLPAKWNIFPAPQSTKQIGDLWIKKGSSVVLEVPSVIVQGEKNYLFNPFHPDFKKIKIGKPNTFIVDQRLLKKLEK